MHIRVQRKSLVRDTYATVNQKITFRTSTGEKYDTDAI